MRVVDRISRISMLLHHHTSVSVHVQMNVTIRLSIGGLVCNVQPLAHATCCMYNIVHGEEKMHVGIPSQAFHQF